MGKLRTWLNSPLAWIVLGALALRLAGLFWGLPGADGWDDDGVAPRNFLVGLAESYTPGHHFTYPPLHMILLGLLCLPGIVLALFSAPTLHPADIIATMTQVPYMTFFSLVARLVSIGFSLGTIVLIAKIGELAGGKRAGLLAALALMLNGAFTYYGVVTNLDGPSLFWAAAAFLYFTRVMLLQEIRAIRWGFLCAAAAVATKDQTYALFLLPLSLGLMVWLASDPWARRNWRCLVQSGALWAFAALFCLLLIDGALTNPHGFADRIAFLRGPASQDYTQYELGPRGWLALLSDSVLFSGRYYPALLWGLAVLGLGRVFWERPFRLFAMLPLLVIVSFTLFFNFVALRSEPRFLLPQSVFVAVYIGLGADLAFSAQKTWLRNGMKAVAGAGAVLALFGPLGIAMAFAADPRLDAERWMAGHMRPGDRVEIYGLNAYLPRIPAGLDARRISPRPLKGRNPLPGITEIRAPYGTAEEWRPRYLVIPGYWVASYIQTKSEASGGGRIVQKVGRAAQLDVDARNYFGALFAGRLPYRLAHRSGYTAPLGPSVNAYESLTQTVFIFERDPARDIEPIVTAPKSSASLPANLLYRGSRRTADAALGYPVQPGLAFVSRGYHIDRTWGWNA